MNNQKTGFWRGFTWQRMLKYFCIFFIITLIVEIVFDFKNWQHYFTIGLLLRRIVSGLIAGFLFSLWHEPGIDDKKK